MSIIFCGLRISQIYTNLPSKKTAMTIGIYTYGTRGDGVGNQEKFLRVLTDILEQAGDRVLFCTGWSVFDGLPSHKQCIRHG